MGVIRISVVGSFRPNCSEEFGAETHGHANAVAEAIEWLAKKVLPNAIARDHALHSEGEMPEKGFARGEQDVGPQRR